MPQTNREVVIYRHAPNPPSKIDKNVNRAGYAECSYCNTWRPVKNGRMNPHNQYLDRKNGHLSCPNPAGALIVIAEQEKSSPKPIPGVDLFMRERIRSLSDDYTAAEIASKTNLSARTVRQVLDTLSESE